MAQGYLPCLSASVAGTGSSTNLLAASTGNSLRVWQLTFGGTAADNIALVFTVAGTATTVTMYIAANSTLILPMTGVPWAEADIGTGITFTAATTSKVTAYYTKGPGG